MGYWITHQEDGRFIVRDKYAHQTVSEFNLSLLCGRCLAEFALPPKSGDPSAVSISYDLSRLIVGCNDGDMIEFSLTSSQLDKYRQTAEKFRSDRMKRNKQQPIAHVKRSTKYPAGDEWHEGYVDDVCIVGQDGDEKSALYNAIGKMDSYK